MTEEAIPSPKLATRKRRVSGASAAAIRFAQRILIIINDN
jgi:hypothetical protein